MIWYAYCISRTDGGDDLGAYTDPVEAALAWGRDLDAGGVISIESAINGTVEADGLDDALDAVRMDDWVSFTQVY